jgi:hypothetical protein
LIKSEIDGDTVPKDLKVKFINDVGVTPKMIRADSEDIKILGAKTYDEAWRITLQKNDPIDALDKDGIWRESTVIEPESRTEYNMPMIKVGFRKYHDKGEKEDHRGGKYDGADGETLIGSCTVRIQKPGSYTKS